VLSLVGLRGREERCLQDSAQPAETRPQPHPQPQATRRISEESFEISGNVTLSNPTTAEWVIGGVLVEAVRPEEVRPVLPQSAT
jgi:hypothetical protein